MKRKIWLCGIFIISLIALLLLFGKSWILRAFGGDITISQILFHLQFPLSGADFYFVRSFILRVLMPSLLFALFITFLPYIVRIVWYRIIPNLFSFIKRRPLVLQSMLCFIILIVSLVGIDQKFKVLKYVKTGIYKEYSTFYEEHFATLSLPTLPPKPRNLIVIFAESMESTYSSQNIPKIASMGGGSHSFLFSIW